jgi:hypothetical protein
MVIGFYLLGGFVLVYVVLLLSYFLRIIHKGMVDLIKPITVIHV